MRRRILFGQRELPVVSGGLRSMRLSGKLYGEAVRRRWLWRNVRNVPDGACLPGGGDVHLSFGLQRQGLWGQWLRRLMRHLPRRQKLSVRPMRGSVRGQPVRHDGDEMRLPGRLRDVCGLLRRDHMPDRYGEHVVREERDRLCRMHRWQDVPEPGVCIPLRGWGVCWSWRRDVFDVPSRLRELLR